MQLDESNKTKKNEQSILKETSKNRNIVSKLQGNPARLQGLKESFKYFTLLKKNQYLERKQYRVSRDETLVCSCIMCPEDQIQSRPQGPQYSYNCGERCLNRFTCTECDVELCPCAEQCKNRRFQKHDDACVYPLRCGGKGMGLFAGERILKGQFIMQYVGEIFQINSAFGRRRVQEYSKSTCTYLMKLNNQEVIDPTSKGNLARFINHSCEPNCITEKWNVLGEVCIGIFAIRDINEDEELTFDYQFDVFHTPLTKCLCGANKCKGYLGLKPTDVTQEEWEEHLENMVCKICQTKTPQDDEQLLLCDKCNCGFHLLCLVPPLSSVPKDAWYCQECQDEKRILAESEKEKEKIEGLLQQKVKQLNNEKKNKKKMDSSSSSSDSDSEYDNRYKMMKSLEKQTVREYLQQKQHQQQQINKLDEEVNYNKKEYLDTNISDLPLPPKGMKSTGTSLNNLDQYVKQSFEYQPQNSGKLQQMQSIVDVAQKKFEEQYNDNNELQQQIEQIQVQNIQNIDTKKECFKINILEQKVVKKNAPLIYKIGNKISFEQIDQQYADFFKKENNLTVIGSVQQISIFRSILTMIEQIIKELKKELGIIEGQIKVPIIYLKRLIMKFNSLDKKQEVNIIYNKSLAHSEEIFPMDRATPIKIKGSKQNIESTVQEISKILKTLCVQRLYISRSETKTVQQNMYHLKQHAEIRISRDSVYNAKGEQTQRDINHPFFYIQYREKEVCLIGTLQQIQDTSNAIKMLLEQETNNEKEMTYFTVLISPQYKEQCKLVKQRIEKDSSSTKVLLFEASHPRKNMTILILCLRNQIKQTKQMFFEMIQEDCQLKLEQFQDQMSMQMCRYVFKYLQNTMMTNDMAFMKNWDLITPYFYQFNIMKYREQKFDNWFVKRCYPSLLRDYETQLYIQYCLGKEIQKNLTDQEQMLRKRNLILLTRKILSAILGFKRHQPEQTQMDGNFQQDSFKRFNSVQEDDTPKFQNLSLISLISHTSQFSKKSDRQKESSDSSSDSSNHQHQKRQSSSESMKSRDLSTKQKHKSHHHRYNYNQKSSIDRYDKYKYEKSHNYDKSRQKQKYQNYKYERPRTSRRYYEDNDYSRSRGYNKRRSSSEGSQKSQDYRRKRQESVDSDKYKNNKYYSGFQFERRHSKTYKYDYEKSSKMQESKERSRSRQRNKSDSSDGYRRRSKSTHKSKKYYRKYQ
ncbi:unnamed protein product [Paramecium octaurelia]|uniref:Histone-lysine N-methyltransferase n=2 Tax=Paramecium octaurelia TaxID=43137 RepID=A0A8S1SYB4_PAROT|nr:unnamed protein product [Paramecium octaurelia]